jgi:hypothetical protein
VPIPTEKGNRVALRHVESQPHTWLVLGLGRVDCAPFARSYISRATRICSFAPSEMLRTPDPPPSSFSRNSSPISSSSSYATASETERPSLSDPTLIRAFDTLELGPSTPLPGSLSPSSPLPPHQIPLPPELPPCHVQLILQEACALHRYLRSSDTSTIVERPERLRAVKMGAAGAWAKLTSPDADVETKLAALTGVNESGILVHGPPFDIVRSNATLSLLSRPFEFIHSTPNEDPSSPDDTSQQSYPLQLLSWIAASAPADGKSEVPAHLPQGDLYLCPETQLAIEGGLGAIAQAIDSREGRKVVALRPPGHVSSFSQSTDRHSHHTDIRILFAALRGVKPFWFLSRQ